MSYPSTDEILASSKGWVASFLNFLPGLGSGYLYQRRWKPYFFTITASTTWFALGFILQGDTEPSQSEQIIGISLRYYILRYLNQPFFTGDVIFSFSVSNLLIAFLKAK